MKKSKVLLVTFPFIPVSQDSLAGTEQITYLLGKSLVEIGHEVHTIAREDSNVYGNLVPGGFTNMVPVQGAELEHFQQAMAYTGSVVRNFIRKNPGLEVIIDRAEGLTLPIAHEEDGPPVICGLDQEAKYFLHPLIFDKLKKVIIGRKDCFAAVSNYIAQNYQQELDFRGLESRMHTIHNGIDTKKFEFSESHENYLLFLGRVVEKKGAHIALQVANETGHKIIIAGGTGEDTDNQYSQESYVRNEISPNLKKGSYLYGPADLNQKVELMKNAKAVIFPTKKGMVEPFGLVPIEAMACGAPVIAFNQGGPKETIIDGKTGFLVDSKEEIVQAVQRLNEINRNDCAQHVVENFDYSVMGRRYSKLIGR